MSVCPEVSCMCASQKNLYLLRMRARILDDSRGGRCSRCLFCLGVARLCGGLGNASVGRTRAGQGVTLTASAPGLSSQSAGEGEERVSWVITSPEFRARATYSGRRACPCGVQRQEGRRAMGPPSISSALRRTGESPRRKPELVHC